MNCQITTKLSVVACLVLMLAVAAFANDQLSDNVKNDLAQSMSNTLDSAWRLGEFLTPNGRFNLEATRRPGYQGHFETDFLECN